MNETLLLSCLFFLAVVLVLAGMSLLHRVPAAKAETLLTAADSLASYAQGVADDHNPSTTTVFERVTGYTATAVHAAEQLYQAGKLPKEQRYAYAEQMVQNLFHLDVTHGSWDDWYQVIDGIIEAAVNHLPKTTPAPIPQKDVPKNPPDAPPAPTPDAPPAPTPDAPPAPPQGVTV